MQDGAFVPRTAGNSLSQPAAASSLGGGRLSSGAAQKRENGLRSVRIEKALRVFYNMTRGVIGAERA